jgi:hypothetical protein
MRTAAQRIGQQIRVLTASTVNAIDAAFAAALMHRSKRLLGLITKTFPCIVAPNLLTRADEVIE